MKLSIAFTLATIALASAQDERRATVKERLIEHRKDMFVNTEGTLEAMKENHERRMTKLEEMLEERRQMLKDHETGHRRLNGEEYEKANRQVKNFQRKLERMQKMDDAEHRERLEELKSLHNMHRLDYLDMN